MENKKTRKTGGRLKLFIGGFFVFIVCHVIAQIIVDLKYLNEIPNLSGAIIVSLLAISMGVYLIMSAADKLTNWKLSLGIFFIVIGGFFSLLLFADKSNMPLATLLGTTTNSVSGVFCLALGIFLVVLHFLFPNKEKTQPN